ncbi:MAG: protein usg [Pseudomonadota bacterium]
MTVDQDFIAQLEGKGVLTTEILYYRPDYRSLLQSFVWQTLDEAPKFPRLAQFLDHWRREIDAVIHSVRIAHADWVGPTEIRAVDGAFRLD